MPHPFPQPWDPAHVGLPPPGYRLPPTAHVGRVRIAVSNLQRAVAFYSQIIGLAVYEPGTPEMPLTRLGPHGETNVLLELEELPGVHPIARRNRLGLYHTAFLLPTRLALSSFVQHLIKHNVPFSSGDHLVSEALYLTDPDGLTVEVYADRPTSTWRVKDRETIIGTIALQFHQMPPVPPDSWRAAPAGTIIGHVHFYVADLPKAANFYHLGLGLDQSMWSLPGALFLSAGGYHHHVGTNTWAAGSPVASFHDARLLFWELLLPDAHEIKRLAASMTAAGYTQTTTSTGAPAFVDEVGLTVALVVAVTKNEKISSALESTT